MTLLINFPYQVERQGRTAVADDAAHVRDLIEQLLFTLPGERVMRPTFGSGLAQLVFQPNSEELATAVQFLIQGSLQQWLGELVTVEDVTVISVESMIEVQIQYVLRRTQERRVDQFSRPV
jgi:phage baseplate assembly protein W